MSRGLKGFVARIVMLLCLFLWGCFLVAPVNITGTWMGTMEWTSGPKAGFIDPITLTLVHSDRELTGTVRLPSPGGLSFSLPIVQGSTRNADLFLIARGANDQVPGNPMVEFQIDGEFEQEVMAGDGTQSIDGKVYAFTWQAVLTTDPIAPAGL
jgi:hypothetical protein